MLHMNRKTVAALGSVLLLTCALWPAALGAAPAVKEVPTVIGENQIVYPQLENLADEKVQQAINEDILVSANIAKHLITLSTLQPGGWGLKVGYEAYLDDKIFSVVIGAKGQMPTGLEGQTYTALCYDLTTGERLKPEDVFRLADEAAAYMEERAVATMTEDLSAYLENGALAPFPIDSFYLDGDGITFYYPYDQFSLLSGYSGACQFYYEELWDYLDLEEDSLLSHMGILRPEYTPEETQAKVAETVAAGRLPHVPVAIGDEMTAVVTKYRLLREPDQFPGGKYYQMETPQFRQVLVLSTTLNYKETQVEGLQSTRTDLFGISTGKTTRTEWQKLLGQPESTLVFDESLAYDYALPVGESDFYTFGGVQLRLHAGADGILHSVRISR